MIDDFKEICDALMARKLTQGEAMHLRLIIDLKTDPPSSDVARNALSEIESSLVGVERYRNMKSFPVVVTMCKKAANLAAGALGRIPPFENPYE